MDAEFIASWIERLGGWGVVLLIVKWFMGRFDRLIEQLQKAVDRFQDFEREETQIHAAIMKRLDELARRHVEGLARAKSNSKE